MRLNLSINPVLVKELRGRMRGPRAYLFLSGILALMGLVSYGLYYLARTAAQYGGGPPGVLIGQIVFSGVVFLTLAVVCVIAPALTSGAISSEHERKTFDLLMATPLHPAAILLGKLMASMSYIVLTLLAIVPLVSLSYIFGGVATIDMFQSFLMLMGFALAYSVIGMFFSALFRRSAPATVASYIVIVVFVFGTLFAYILFGVVNRGTPSRWLLVLNPISAMASGLADQSAAGSNGMGSFFFGLGGGDFNSPTRQAPLWHYTAGIYAWLTLTLYAIGVQLVKPVRRFRFGVRGWIGVVAFVVISILAVLMAFGPLPPDRIVAWVRWNMSYKRNVTVNGNFADDLASGWRLATESEHTHESGGEARLITDGGRQVVSFSRVGTGHGETSITQEISQTVSSNDWLQVRLVLRVQDHDLAVCGVAGAECPVMVTVVFEDQRGGRHTWMQGFYAKGDPEESGWPTLCTSCDAQIIHTRVPLGEWYTFESSNLLDSPPWRLTSPRAIRLITISAAGHSYKSQVAEVSVLMREGRPPDWGSLWPTPTPSLLLRPTVVPMRAIPVPPPPLPLEPTATPDPATSPTPAPTPTPWITSTPVGP